MLAYIYHILTSFRSLFVRRRPYLLFCLVMLGFLIAPPLEGVTMFCRIWGLSTPGYYALLHFFRSTAWSLDAVISHWGTFVLSQNVHLLLGDRAIALGDHVYVPKDGRRMPGVVTLHQDSDTQSKPSYFRGHRFGALGLVAGSWEEPSCIPLDLRIHQGFVHLGITEENTTEQPSLCQRMFLMALSWALQHNRPLILVLDAFFAVSTVFEQASRVMLGAIPYITVLTRAKKNYTAYRPAPPPPENKTRGRPRKYGQKVVLDALFEHTALFERAEARIYGKKETITYRMENLLFKPFGALLRFVWVQSSRGSMVLMCNDLTIDPLIAIELYCLRIRIEVMFSWLKNLMGAFCYRFWSQALERHSRKPKKNDELKAPPQDALARVAQVWGCYERFAMLGAMSLGILKLVAIRFGHSVWGGWRGFLRSKSRTQPSPSIVKNVLAAQFMHDFHNLPCDGTLQKIQTFCQPLPSPPKRGSYEQSSEAS